MFETRYQRAYLDQLYGGDVVGHLDRIGLLSPRLTLAHCVWARPDELQLFAARGVTIVTNASSNLRLMSGLAPVARMLGCGCRLALGVDGGALDDDDDMLREMRLAHLLHAGTGFATAMREGDAFRAAVTTGRLSVTNSTDAGAIAPGEAADILLLDYDALDDDGLRGDLDPLSLIFARATARHIREVIVDGRSVVQDRIVLGIDLPAARREVLIQMRSGAASFAPLAAALPALDHALSSHIESAFRCL
jgi:cytosine/adenosine deaminase-related metal-dependent hydrolase